MKKAAILTAIRESNVDELKARRTYLTHICHDLAHERAESLLPEHVRLAYDGLELRVA